MKSMIYFKSLTISLILLFPSLFFLVVVAFLHRRSVGKDDIFKKFYHES